MTYPNTQLFINGQWQDAADGRTLPVFNPATLAEGMGYPPDDIFAARRAAYAISQTRRR